MRKIIFLAAAAIICSGCAERKVAHQRINTLPIGEAVTSLTDCTVPATFTSDNFNWMGGNLTMTVYNEDLYDAVEISLMQVGDTLIYEGEPMVVDSLDNANGVLNVNGGLDQGGCWLRGNGGGTYRAITFDDHSIYTKVATHQVPLHEDFIIIDCGENPSDPCDTIRQGQKKYLESLENSRRNFHQLNTKVCIEHGCITEINRRWIP